MLYNSLTFLMLMWIMTLKLKMKLDLAPCHNSLFIYSLMSVEPARRWNTSLCTFFNISFTTCSQVVTYTMQFCITVVCHGSIQKCSWIVFSIIINFLLSMCSMCYFLSIKLHNHCGTSVQRRYIFRILFWCLGTNKLKSICK